MNIGVDVDLVVVPSDVHWLNWLIEVTGKEVSEVIRDYDLTSYFKEELDSLGLSGFEWWRGEGIYDDMIPFQNAIDTINSWSEAGDRVTFISSIKGNHNKSKYYFLKKYFSFDSYVATKEKYVVDVDVMIDDRPNHLESFIIRKPETIPILFPTQYTTDTPLNPEVAWSHLYDQREYDFDIY